MAQEDPESDANQSQKKHSLRDAFAVLQSPLCEIQEVPRVSLTGLSRNWASESPSRVCNSKSSNQHQGQHMNTDCSDSRAAPCLELSQPSQTTTTHGHEGLNHNRASRSTLNAGRLSSLKILNNQNTASTTNPSDGMRALYVLQQSRRLEPQSESMATVAASPPRSQHQNNGPSTRQASHVCHPDWLTYTFVDIFVHGLPPNVSTLDLYKNFIQHGEITMITIKNASGGALKRQADIRFKPPPREAFWAKCRHDFKDGSGANSTVGVQLSQSQPKNFTVQSPVGNGLEYNEEMELHAESIDFGVLTNPSTMMAMKKRPSLPESKVRLILNLKHREIDIRFPPSPRVAQEPLYKIYPWMRPEYRFSVSLDQDFSITLFHEPDNKLSFILRLNSPPPYSKKEHEQVEGSHVPEARRWLENDLWLRQTAIVRPRREGNEPTTPVSLAVGEGGINLGRWTTFRITFEETEKDQDKFRIITRALRDFNVKVGTVNEFKFVTPAPPVWKFLDQHLLPQISVTTSHVNDLSLLEDSLSLPFSVRYLLDVCISTRRLNEYVVGKDFLQALNEAEEFRACNRLKLILDMPQNKELVDPMSVFDNRKFRPVLRKPPRIPENCALIHSATVTASTIIFHAPSVEITNRIIRQYKQHSDRFLRVRFEDDEYKGNSRIYATTTNKMDAIFRRVRRTLTCGIQIGDRKYEFLAWGNSQLREHAAYFFADLPNVLTASQIRAVMGQFDHEKIIAKRAARMGQCFSTTMPVKLRIPKVTRTSLIDDVIRNGYTFTDGVGQISPLLADLINHQLKLDDQTPSLYQFRLGGCKGVLAVSDELKGIDIRLRRSQFKFASDSNDLEVIRSSRLEAAHLNRQVILVLSALGVDDSVFLAMQEKEIKELDAAMGNDAIASEKLRATVDANKGTLEIADLVDRGFRAGNEPFVTSLLRLWRAWSLKYLKEKAKLHVENGANLLGCVDEKAILQGHYNDYQPSQDATYEERIARLPEIFVQVETPESKEHRSKQKRAGEKPDLPVYQAKEGLCLIARNPSLHEGDIRVVRAVNVPALSHLRDVLVMPQTGDKDLPSMCSGGDLDGDDYLVIWAEDLQTHKFDLLPMIWNADPMDYRAPPPVCAEGDITQDDIIQFFVQYMRNDFLGRIAHAHLGWADSHDDGIRSEQCLELANLHSQAVDYPKTGWPAELPRALDRFEWPHFMEKGGKKYHSNKVLGKLYDKVERVKFVPNYRGAFDDRILNAYEPPKAIRDQVEGLKKDYDSSLRRIMTQHEIKTEFEVWSTFVLDHSRASSDYKFHEQIGNLSKSLKEEFGEAIAEAAGGRSPVQLGPYAVAAYQLVSKEVSVALEKVDKGEMEEVPEHMPFMSFPWVLQEILGKIAVEACQPGPSKTSVQVAVAGSDKHLDAKNLLGGKRRIQSNFQGDIYADPYQPGTISAENKVDGLSAKPTAANASQSTGQLTLAARSSSAAAGKVTGPLDRDEDEGIGAQPETLDETNLVAPRSGNRQGEGVEQTFGTPSGKFSRGSDRTVYGPNKSSALPSHVVSAASSNDLMILDQQEDISDKPDMQCTNLKPSSAGLEDLTIGQMSYVDASGIYRSKFRRSSGRSGSSSILKGNRPSSGEGNFAATTLSPRPGSLSSSTFALRPLPDQASTLVQGDHHEIKRIFPGPDFTAMSGKAPFGMEIDSDDEGEVMIYADPAGMTL